MTRKKECITYLVDMKGVVGDCSDPSAIGADALESSRVNEIGQYLSRYTHCSMSRTERSLDEGRQGVNLISRMGVLIQVVGVSKTGL